MYHDSMDYFDMIADDYEAIKAFECEMAEELDNDYLYDDDDDDIYSIDEDYYDEGDFYN